MSSNANESEMLDVAIVGGGVSGVYSAYRLLTSDLRGSPELANLARARSNGKLRVSVFELSNRIGGRLLSVSPPDMPHITAELGGMRYMSTHTYVKSLVENKLRLRTRAFPVDEPENLVYLRGERFREQDLTNCGTPNGPTLPYNLSWSEREGDPRNLISNAIDAMLPGLTAMNAEQMWATLRSAEVDGRHMYNYGLWDLVNKALSYEAYSLARVVGAYDCLTMNYNAADTVVASLEFVPGTTFSAFVDGYVEVPKILAQMTIDEGGQIVLEKTLRSVTNESGSGITLSFADGSLVRAHKVILAMPRRSLEMLDPVGPVFSNENTKVRKLIRSVSSVPLFKLFTCYRYPWWEAAGVTQGRSITDLPIRQCYYWGVEGRQDGADPTNTNALMLATYDDAQNTEFWAGLRDRHAHPAFQNEGTAGEEVATDIDGWQAFEAPQPMVEEVHRQLMELHGVRFAPQPYAAAYRDWSEDPFGGAVHLWKIHEKSWKVIPKMIQPVGSLDVYVCGEAYSNAQTWVEGALETAELILQGKFGLAKPPWLYEQVMESGS
jgi:monoamine oxidase